MSMMYDCTNDVHDVHDARGDRRNLDQPHDALSQHVHHDVLHDGQDIQDNTEI